MGLPEIEGGLLTGGGGGGGGGGSGAGGMPGAWLPDPPQAESKVTATSSCATVTMLLKRLFKLVISQGNDAANSRTARQFVEGAKFAHPDVLPAIRFCSLSARFSFDFDTCS